MYVGLGIVFVAIGLIALGIMNVNPWIAALLILVGLLSMIANMLLPERFRRQSRNEVPPLG
jgi:apolipoprotein N-acyltransferase